MIALPAAVAALAASASLLLIRALRPLLLRYALARPNARSSHASPTPQGGGIAVGAAALGARAGGGARAPAAWMPGLPLVAGATVMLAVLGLLDDIRPLPAALRLPVQLACVATVVLVVPGRILPEAVPLAAERALLVLAGTWWVNLVNFMDGIDWMTVAGIVPLCGALCFFGFFGHLPAAPVLVAAALGGALLGFAPANRPVARLFLGDVGSLPIGLLSGWLLLELAKAGHLAAALLLPLYYIADATIARGWSVPAVDRRVFALDLGLAALAGATLAWPLLPVQAGALAVGSMAVALTLRDFARER